MCDEDIVRYIEYRKMSLLTNHIFIHLNSPAVKIIRYINCEKNVYISQMNNACISYALYRMCDEPVQYIYSMQACIQWWWHGMGTFHITDPSRGEYLSYRWILSQKASDAEHCCFPCCCNYYYVVAVQTHELRRHEAHVTSLKCRLPIIYNVGSKVCHQSLDIDSTDGDRPIHTSETYIVILFTINHSISKLGKTHTYLLTWANHVMKITSENFIFDILFFYLRTFCSDRCIDPSHNFLYWITNVHLEMHNLLVLLLWWGLGCGICRGTPLYRIYTHN